MSASLVVTEVTDVLMEDETTDEYQTLRVIIKQKAMDGTVTTTHLALYGNKINMEKTDVK